MNAPLKLVIEIITIIKSNSTNDRLFHQFCDDEEHQTLLMHPVDRWLSKGKSLIRIVELWDILVIFSMIFQQMDQAIGKRKSLEQKYIVAIENEK